MSQVGRIIIFLGVGVVIITLVVVFGRTPPPRTITPLGIRLSGLTCIVSNSNDRAIWFWPVASQVKSNGEWPKDLVRLRVRYTPLKPSQTVQFTVTRPANAEVWRVPVFWVLQPLRKEWIDEVIRQNMLALQSSSPLPGVRIGWGSTESWTNYSSEVRGERLP